MRANEAFVLRRFLHTRTRVRDRTSALPFFVGSNEKAQTGGAQRLVSGLGMHCCAATLDDGYIEVSLRLD